MTKNFSCNCGGNPLTKSEVYDLSLSISRLRKLPTARIALEVKARWCALCNHNGAPSDVSFLVTLPNCKVEKAYNAAMKIYLAAKKKEQPQQKG